MKRTPSLIQPLPNRLQLLLKLGVLLVNFLVGLTKQSLERLDALVAGEEFAFGEGDVSLEGGVLVNELEGWRRIRGGF